MTYGLLITDNSKMVDDLAEKQKQIERLQSEKENLIKVNGNLLQQVGMGEDTTSTEEKKEIKKEFSYRDMFDEKGNFKK